MGILHRASALLVSASPLLTSVYTEGDFYIFKRAENTTSLASAWYEHGPEPTIAAKVPDGISWHGNYHYVPEEDGERIVSLLEPQGLLDRRTIDGAGAEPTVFFAKPTVEVIVHGEAFVNGTNGRIHYRMGDQNTTMFYTSGGYMTSHTPTTTATIGTHEVEHSWTTSTEVTTTGTSTIQHTSISITGTHAVENSHTTTTAVLVTATSTSSGTILVPSTSTHVEHTTTTSTSGVTTKTSTETAHLFYPSTKTEIETSTRTSTTALHTEKSTITHETVTTKKPELTTQTAVVTMSTVFEKSEKKRDVAAPTKETTYEVIAEIKSAGTSLTEKVTVLHATGSLASYSQYNAERGEIVPDSPRDNQTITKTETTIIYEHSATKYTTETSTFTKSFADTVTFIHPTTDTIHATTVHEHETTTTTTRYSVVTEKPKPTKNAAIALSVPSWLKLRKQQRQVLPASHSLEIIPYSGVTAKPTKALSVDEMINKAVEDVVEDEDAMKSEFATRVVSMISAMPQVTDASGLMVNFESVLQLMSDGQTSLNARESSFIREEVGELASELIEKLVTKTNVMRVPIATATVTATITTMRVPKATKTLYVDAMVTKVVDGFMRDAKAMGDSYLSSVGHPTFENREAMSKWAYDVEKTLTAMQGTLMVKQLADVASQLVDAMTADGNVARIPMRTTVTERTTVSANAAVGIRAPTLLAGLLGRRDLAPVSSEDMMMSIAYPHITVREIASAVGSEPERTIRGSIGGLVSGTVGFTLVVPVKPSHAHAARATESVCRAGSPGENACRIPAPDAKSIMSTSTVDEEKAEIRAEISSLYSDLFLDKPGTKKVAPMTTDDALVARDEVDDARASLSSIISDTDKSMPTVKPRSGDIICNERKKLPWAERVVQGIDYLRDIKKDINIEPCAIQGQTLGVPSTKRPRSCVWQVPDETLGDDSDLFNCQSSRVSCSHETAIFVVNCNMQKPVNTTSNFIAEKASKILSTCCYGRTGTDFCDNERLDSVLGMKSGGLWKNDADKWYVDVRRTDGLGDNC